VDFSDNSSYDRLGTQKIVERAMEYVETYNHGSDLSTIVKDVYSD